MKKNNFFINVSLVLLTTLILGSCKSVDFSKTGAESEVDSDNEFKNYKEETEYNSKEIQDYLIQERVKEVDVEKTIVYVEKPVYYPVGESAKSDRPELKGKDAAKKSTEDSIQVPEKFTNGTMYYDFDNDFTYEIYCQPYRVTDLMLEPGEQVIEMPFLSEEKVWEIGAGVSRNGNIDTQHFFLKPAYSGLISSFIIITDKRVYHILLKSFKDCFMTQVKWNYPNTMPFTLKTEAMNERMNKMNRLTKETVGVDPRYLSFDYKMTYSPFKKPYWLPVRIYDDGAKTYIVMNETVLHMTSPILFNQKNERINYSVDKTLIIIPELVEKVTMRVGKERVTIRKKNFKETKIIDLPEEPEEEIKLEEDESSKRASSGFAVSCNSKAKKETKLHSSDIFIESKIADEEQKKGE